MIEFRLVKIKNNDREIMINKGLKIDAELKIFLLITRNFPPLRGMIRIGKFFRNFYLRKKRGNVTVDVLGFKMNLEPNKGFSSSACLFFPQLYDWREIRFLKRSLKRGDIFIDIGAHIGFYSLMASSIIGKEGKILAIEADPNIYQKLTYNIKLNSLKSIIPVSAGVSDRTQTLRLNINREEQGKNSFLGQRPNGINVQCYSLIDIINKNRIFKIDGLKIDIENFEYKVLVHFFNNASPNLYPKFIIVEYRKNLVKNAGGDVIDLLKKYGYKENFHAGANYIMIKNDKILD